MFRLRALGAKVVDAGVAVVLLVRYMLHVAIKHINHEKNQSGPPPPPKKKTDKKSEKS